MAKKQLEEEEKEEPKTRLQKFDEELIALQTRYMVKIYPVLQTFDNGEVHPIIKIKDNFKIDIVKE